MVYVLMTEVLIKSGGGMEDTKDILPLTSVPLSLSPPPYLMAATLEGRIAKASRCNEEKCVNLARPVCRLSTGWVKVH